MWEISEEQAKEFAVRDAKAYHDQGVGLNHIDGDGSWNEHGYYGSAYFVYVFAFNAKKKELT